MLSEKYKKAGTLILDELRQVYKPTFLDFLKGGLQLNLSIAIDFTQSNKKPKDPQSLHYMDLNGRNQYQ